MVLIETHGVASNQIESYGSYEYALSGILNGVQNWHKLASKCTEWRLQIFVLFCFV